MIHALTIMTYNIRGALYDDGQNNWPYREPLNVRLLEQHAPDLIGFQEVHQENLSILKASHLAYAHDTGTPYNDKAPFQYPAVAWNPQQLRQIASGGFWLSQTPYCHSRSWDTACIRSATWEKFEWPATRLSFVHLNTHLDHISELARVEGTKLILQFLETVHLPLIVTGDFNCNPASEAYRLFTEHGYMDAYIAAGNHGIRWTYHGYQGKRFIPHQIDFDRIDWILLRDWSSDTQVGHCSILDDAQPPLYPSDHYPVLARIEFPGTQ
jgi:endonuclease/exonuclease/phosphatase family metal-dependent hydrolase